MTFPEFTTLPLDLSADRNRSGARAVEDARGPDGGHRL
jgi:hypothetical protein